MEVYDDLQYSEAGIKGGRARSSSLNPMHLISLGPRKTPRISHFLDVIALSMCLVVYMRHLLHGEL